MILVADSGSTKTNWIAINEKGETYFKIDTDGLNPAVFTKKTLYDRIITKEELRDIKDEVKEIYFYGAGCGTQNAVQFLKTIFEDIFTNAHIEIYEDTIAAVKSLQTDTPGVVCILGTGSNCSYFDGKETHQKIVSLGYILMDSASGNYYGKQIIKDHAYGKMPEDLAIKFEAQYDLRPDVIKENLYKRDNPNTYLANVGRFLIENKESDYAQKIIKDGLRFFVENQILQFEESKDVPIYFVGSIAHFLQDEIVEVLQEYNLTLGKIVRHPIMTLAAVHASKLTK
ncbi:BadF/BadG/BcrA/BcrD ATPase family protein [Lutimonas vermicola]|uniref:BadF/BadG/BcrA/BcrD ATPase family protein n=1 Tax=Lutimonas vermicola TaxID=414288 RepID=A0ABU9KYM6_9FLAO